MAGGGGGSGGALGALLASGGDGDSKTEGLVTLRHPLSLATPLHHF